MYWTKQFWKATAERAIKTAAQVTGTAIGGNLVNAWELDYSQLAGIAIGSTLLSILTSIGSAKIGDSNGPSLGPEDLAPKP